MNTFNSTSFIDSLQKVYEAIPVMGKGANKAAKTMVASANNSNGFSPEETVTYIYNEMGLSTKTDADWEMVVDAAIKNGGVIGNHLEQCKKVCKGKVSNKDIFTATVTAEGKNPISIMEEIRLDKMGWYEVVKTLLKTHPTNGAKSVDTIVIPTVSVKKTDKVKTAIKGADSRRKSVSLINIKTGEKKEWSSYRECEIEFGIGHGTISQLISGKVKTIKGAWRLYIEGEGTLVKAPHSRSKALRQYGEIDGVKVDKIWSSLTEASKTTGINHSSISKAATGAYNMAGGYHWEYVENATLV